MRKNGFGIFLILVLMTGCGGGSSNNSGSGITGSTTGEAQGVYSGSTSTGYSFSTIVLPNDKFYGIYGTNSGSEFLIYGMLAGQGTSGQSSYTASVSDFFYNGAVNSGNINATYVAGTSVNGTLTENGASTTFTGSALPSSSFNYGTPASISAIAGSWTGSLLDGITTTVTISSSGSLSGSSSGCSFSGTVTPDSSNKNFFEVSLTFGASPCSFPNQTATGVGIEYLLSNGTTHQLIAGVTVGGSSGTVFVAER